MFQVSRNVLLGATLSLNLLAFTQILLAISILDILPLAVLLADTSSHDFKMRVDDLTITSMDVSCTSLQLINLEGAKSSTRYPFTRHYHNSVIISRRCRPNDAKVQRLKHRI